MTPATNFKSAAPTTLVQTCAIAILPVVFYVTSAVLRATSGADWLWRVMDPDYFYLFDGLNVATLTSPNHVGHPGVPLSAFVGIVLRVLHPFASGDELAAQVIADPAFHLDAASAALMGLNAIAMFVAGLATWRATGDWIAVGLVQLGPALSTLTVHNALYVRPEALLVAASMAAAALVMAAVRRHGEPARPSAGSAVAFGICAGFVGATKIVAAPMFALLPVFLLGTARLVVLAWLAAAVAAVVFFLPAITEAGRFVDWLLLLATGSGVYGAGLDTVVDPASYLWNFRRALVRPAASVPLTLGILALAAAYRRARRRLPVRTAEMKALAGVLLATVAHAAIVAKQPSGHYMIPVFCLSGLSLALAYRVALDPSWWSKRWQRPLMRGAATLFALAVVAQGFSLARLAETMRRFDTEASMRARLSSDRCAEVFFYPVSHPDFALLMGHYQSGYRFGGIVSQNVAQSSFYIRDWFPYDKPEVRNAGGAVPLNTILAQYPCVAFRGGHEDRLNTLLASEGLADLKFESVCRAPYETAYVVGAECTAP